MRSVIDILDLSEEELNDLIATAEDIIKNPEKYSDKCKDKKLATLFFEPSTRTRFSFEAAMYELGGHVISMSDASNTSISKGESLADMVRAISCYSDIIAIRHPYEGAALHASLSATVPVINAGDGGHCHPTQTLADLLTIHLKKGTFNNLTIGFCGDLKYGRTVHSLINALSRYKNVNIVLISPEELKLPDYIKKDVIAQNGINYSETASLENALPCLDILYMTRIQRERFDDKDEYNRLKGSYVLDSEKMKSAKEDCCILHPLPRVDEISIEVDDDPRACYFDQVLNGKYMRMALMLKLLFEKDTKKCSIDYKSDIYCTNPKCISLVERGIKQAFMPTDDASTYKCAYCETSYKIK